MSNKMKLNKILTSIAASALMLFGVVSANADVVISGIFDGPLDGGEPKVIELYVTADGTDLSQYALGSANNGGGTDGVELIMSGIANAGDYVYIIDDTSDSAFLEEFNSYFGFTPTIAFDGTLGSGGGPTSFNGDDAIELFFDATGAFAGGESVNDVFGDINVDGSGQPWDYLDGWAYRIDDTGPDGSTFVLGNWNFSGINANDGETSNAASSNPFPIGTYTQSAAIPEPGTIGLVSVLACVALTRRRR